SVLLVESDRGASATIRANISDVGVAGARLLASTVARALDRPATLRYDVVLADPPYDVTAESLASILGMRPTQQSLAQEPVVVVERSSRSPEPAWPDGIVGEGPKRYGETVLWFASLSAPDFQI